MKRYLQSVEEVVKVLKEGKEILDLFCDNIRIRMIDGVICYTTKNNHISINTSLFLEKGKNRFYTEEPEPLKFEVNRAYKTSNGEKVFLYKKFNNNGYNLLYFIGDRLDFNTYDNGKFLKDGAINIHNIVGYWEE